METTSGLEFILRSFESGARRVVFDMGPWIVAWLAIASPCLWQLARIRKKARGLFASLIVAVCFGFFVASVCAAVHFVLAFGEAWDGGINRDRVQAFVVLTAIFVPFSAIWLRSWRPRMDHAKDVM
jgi:hypothetical protein